MRIYRQFSQTDFVSRGVSAEKRSPAEMTPAGHRPSVRLMEDRTMMQQGDDSSEHFYHLPKMEDGRVISFYFTSQVHKHTHTHTHTSEFLCFTFHTHNTLHPPPLLPAQRASRISHTERLLLPSECHNVFGTLPANGLHTHTHTHTLEAKLSGPAECVCVCVRVCGHHAHVRR